MPAVQVTAARAGRRRVVVVGGGMLGLGLARELADHCDVMVLEGAPHLGGLVSAWTLDTGPLDTGPRDTGRTDTGPPATGNLEPGDDAAGASSVTWDRFYHVVLSADRRVLALYDELGLGGSVHWSTVRSELLSPDGVLPMSTVADLLKLRVLRPVDRVRVGLTVGLGAVLPMGRRADSITAVRWVRRWSGRRAGHDLWEPLLRAKLGSESEHTSSIFLRATFRRLLLARLRGGVGDRFGWVEGGYGRVVDRLAASLTERGVDIRCGASVDSIDRAADGRGADGGGADGGGAGGGGEGGGGEGGGAAGGGPADGGGGWIVRTRDGDLRADDVVVTAAGPPALRLLAQASAPVRAGLGAAHYLGCVCVSVVLRRPITGAYLTYVTDETPYTAIVEMSNHVDPAQFGGHSLVYLPKYTSPNDPLMDEDPDVIAERFVTDLIARYPAVGRDDVLARRTARARYVMPVPVPGWKQVLPPFRAGPPGLWLASSVQVEDGTLNVETTLKIAADAAEAILAHDPDPVTDTHSATDTDTASGSDTNPGHRHRRRP